METIDTEKMKRTIFDAVVQLDSYNNILSGYMELHENILEMNHACLLVDKMQEQIDDLGKGQIDDHNTIINNIQKEHDLIAEMILKENQFYVDDNFSIKKIPEYEIYQKEVGDDILMKVQNWIIDKKQFQVVDKDFICKQIVNFSKRNGLI